MTTALDWRPKDVGFRNHPKMRTLVLRTRNPLGWAHWDLVLDYCYEANQSFRFTGPDAVALLEDVAEWRGTPGELHGHLVDLHLLDTCEGGWEVHNALGGKERAAAYVESVQKKREGNRKRQAARRKKLRDAKVEADAKSKSEEAAETAADLSRVTGPLPSLSPSLSLDQVAGRGVQGGDAAPTLVAVTGDSPAEGPALPAQHQLPLLAKLRPARAKATPVTRDTAPELTPEQQAVVDRLHGRWDLMRHEAFPGSRPEPILPHFGAFVLAALADPQVQGDEDALTRDFETYLDGDYAELPERSHPGSVMAFAYERVWQHCRPKPRRVSGRKGKGVPLEPQGPCAWEECGEETRWKAWERWVCAQHREEASIVWCAEHHEKRVVNG